MFFEDEKTIILIDGANIYATSKNLDFDIDYKQKLEYLKEQANVLRAYYYTSLIEDQEYSSIRPLIDWLDYNGYTVIAKSAKEFTDSAGRRKIKGNINVELAVDAMEVAENVDHVVLMSGDGDFVRLVAALQRKGKRVTVVSTVKTQPPMIADDLRRQADQFLELKFLEKEFGRAIPERPVRETREPELDY